MNFDEPVQGHLHWNDGEYSDGKKLVWRTIIILSVVTVVEVGVAMLYNHFMGEGGSGRMAINAFMVIMSVVKVFYIMGTFMHLGHETKGFKMTVLLPFSFLIWAIIAFTYEGASWHAMRQLLNIF